MVKRIVLFLMAVVILIALGIIISPMVIGHYLKTNYSKVLGHLMPGKNIHFKLISYQRGWYTDHAVVQMDLSQSKWRINGQSQITFNQTIDVGPILRQPNGGFMWQLARITTNYDKNGTKFQSTILVDLHKKVVATSTFNLVTISQKTKSTRITQAKTKMTLKKGMREIQANLGSLSSWQHSQSMPSLSANGVQYHKTVLGKKPNTENSTAINMDSITVGNDPQKQIHAKHALIQRRSLNHGDNVTVNYRLYAKELSIGDLPTRTMEVDFTINDLSKALMASLSHDISNFFHPGHGKNQWVVMQDVVKVLSKGLAVKLNKIFMTTPSGPVTVSGMLALPAANGIAQILNPLADLHAQLQGQVPLPWLLKEIMAHQKLKSKNAAMAKVNRWVKKGLLKQEKDAISFSLVYKNRQFYLSTPDHKTLTRFYWEVPSQVSTMQINSIKH